MSDGAYLPRVRAPPEPAKLWHMAQLTRKSSPPLAGSPLAGVDVLLGGDGGAGGQGRDVGADLVDLLLGELDVATLGLDAGRAHRHAAGAHLEVDGCGSDAGQRGSGDLVAVAGRASLGVDAVARGAVGLEELLAGGDVLRGARLGLAGCGATAA